MQWIEIGILIFVLIICFIVAVLYFLALDSLGQSRAGILDDDPTDTAYSWGIWATLAIVITIALLLSCIVLYYYELSGQTVTKVLLFVSFIAVILSGIFAMKSRSNISNILNSDSEADYASNLMFYAIIASFIAAFFIFILLALSVFSIYQSSDIDIDITEEELPLVSTNPILSDQSSIKVNYEVPLQSQVPINTNIQEPQGIINLDQKYYYGYSVYE